MHYLKLCLIAVVLGLMAMPVMANGNNQPVHVVKTGLGVSLAYYEPGNRYYHSRYYRDYDDRYHHRHHHHRYYRHHDWD